MFNVNSNYVPASPPHSVSSPPRIITRSRAALLKNDENDAMLVDSIVEKRSVTYVFICF